MWLGKRFFDIVASLGGLIILSPVFIVVGSLIKLDSRGPVFFRQLRVGLNGKTFYIHKFRTMRIQAEQLGLQITVGNDSRITKIGKILRKYKLDELPQLIDVLQGTMSIVGPRPEVPKYVAQYPESTKALVLSVKPGITDEASIKFKDENEILGKSANAEYDYVHKVLPTKLEFQISYVKNASFINDVKIIFQTIREIFISR